MNRGWFSQKIFPMQQGEASINYLWGHYNDEQVQSFIEEFADVQVESGNYGFDGVDRFIENNLLKQTKSKIGIQYAAIEDYLRTKFNYKLGQNLFCFPYDWRQPSHDYIIYNQLDTLLKFVNGFTQQKALLIAHSGGLNYVRNYMKVNQEWGRYIGSLLTINCPVDGAGGRALACPINGYNLNLPITNVGMKGSERLASIMLNYMPQGANEYICKSSFCSSIFVKRIRQCAIHAPVSEQNSIMVPKNNACSMQNAESVAPKADKTSTVSPFLGQGACERFAHLSEKYQNYKLNLAELGSALPNAATLLLHNALKNGQILFKTGLMSELASGIPDEILGEEMINDFQIDRKRKKASCEQIVQGGLNRGLEELRQRNGQVKEGDWEWEEYAPWQQNKQEQRDYQLECSGLQTAMKEKEGKTEVALIGIDEKNRNLIENGFSGNVCKFEDGEEVYQIAQARNVMQQLKCDKVFDQLLAWPEANKRGKKRMQRRKENKIKTIRIVEEQEVIADVIQQQDIQKSQSNIAQQISEQTNTAKPWTQINVRKDIYKDLMVQLYPKNSFEDMVFGPSQEDYENTLQMLSFQIAPPPPDFKHYSIISTGIPTPLHVVYPEPVASVSELLVQKPQFIFGDGDGLVPLASAATPIFSKEYCGGLFVVPNCKHAPVLSEKRVLDIIGEVLGREHEKVIGGCVIE